MTQSNSLIVWPTDTRIRPSENINSPGAYIKIGPILIALSTRTVSEYDVIVTTAIAQINGLET